MSETTAISGPETAMQLTSSKIQLGDVELSYHRGGRGRTLVYLHGCDGLYAHARVLDRLAEDFDIIAPILPGFERSQLPDWLDSIDDYAHLTIALMDKLGLTNVALAGASIGGWIAAEIATKNQSRIGALALVAPVGIKVGPPDRLDVPDIFAMRDASLRKMLFHNPDKAVQDFSTLGDEELTAIARNRETLAMVSWEPYMHNPKLARRLFGVDVPTLLLRGSSDGMISQNYIEAFSALMHKARVQVLADCGHFPHVEQPGALCVAIAAFAKL